MTWTIFLVPGEKKSQLDEVLRDELIARQSQKVRDAATYRGPLGQLYVQVEGSDEAVRRAETLLSELGTKLPSTDAERLRAQFHEEDDAASAGMGLFFTE